MEIHEVLSSPTFYAGLTGATLLYLGYLAKSRAPKVVSAIAAVAASTVLFDLGRQANALEPDGLTRVILPFIWGIAASVVSQCVVNDYLERRT